MTGPSETPFLRLAIALTGEKRPVLVVPKPSDEGLLGPASLELLARAFTVIAVTEESLLSESPSALEKELDGAAALSSSSVLFIPPLGRLQASRNDRSEIATENLSAALRPDASLVVALIGPTISGRRTEVLERIIGTRYVRAVVSTRLAELAPDVHSSIMVYMVALQPEPPERVHFIGGVSPASLEEASSQLAELEGGAKATNAGFSVPGPINTRSGLSPHSFDPEIAKLVASTEEIGVLVPLSEVCELRLGLPSGVKPAQQLEPYGIPVIGPRMITADGLAIDQPDRWISGYEEAELQPGDLLIPVIGRFDENLRVGLVQEGHLPAVASSKLFVIRPGKHLRAAERVFLRHFLASASFTAQLDQASTSGLRNISQTNLREIQVPLPDEDFLRAIEDVNDAVERLETWRRQGTSLLTSVLDSNEMGAARRELIDKSNLLRQRSDAAEKLDDLSHRISTRFPLPIAYRWRAAAAAKDGPDSLESILKAQEVLLCYLAVIAIVSARVADVELGQLQDIRGRFKKKRGVTLGDWRAFLSEVAEAKKIRRLPDTHPFIEIRSYFRDPAVVDASTMLADLRNDNSHLREFGPGEKAQAIQDAWSSLELLYSAAEFTTDYPLIQITGTRWDSFKQENAVTYRHLQGDSPIVPASQIKSTDSNIETDSLYLMDRDNKMHLLRPFLVGRGCPSCGHWSTFHPDRVTQSGKVQYKSLEHGHPCAMDEQRPSLSAVGILD